MPDSVEPFQSCDVYIIFMFLTPCRHSSDCRVGLVVASAAAEHKLVIGWIIKFINTLECSSMESVASLSCLPRQYQAW